MSKIKQSNSFSSSFKVIMYHGSMDIVKHPVLGKSKYSGDFGNGFYITRSFSQAKRRAIKGIHVGYVNVYEYTQDENLSYKVFTEMNLEWLQIIANSRKGNSIIMIL